MVKGKVTTNEIMDFLQEHMVMRSDLQDFMKKDDAALFLTKEDAVNFMTKEDSRRLEHRMFVLEDQQAKLIQTVELELLAPTRRVDRLERRVGIIESNLGLAT